MARDRRLSTERLISWLDDLLNEGKHLDILTGRLKTEVIDDRKETKRLARLARIKKHRKATRGTVLAARSRESARVKARARRVRERKARELAATQAWLERGLAPEITNAGELSARLRAELEGE